MTPQVQYHTIAGQNGGKRVSCKPELVPAFQNLQRASRSGNYWATIAVREIESLSTGLEGKSNVYFRPGAKEATSGTQVFTVFLPGLKATLFKWPDGNIRIDELQLDGMYELAKKEDRARLGLYRVLRTRNSGHDAWAAKYEDSGNIEPNTGRVVAIADATYSDANRAASRVVPTLIGFPNIQEASIRNSGCDLHFTPGRRQLGGLIAYNPLSINASRASAVHLAESMAKAQSVNNVFWVADRGGSAVLTQAMQILVDRGLTLKGHSVYFNKPRTSPALALRLAHSLEMSLNKDFAATGISLRGLVSQLSVAPLRINNGDDPYDRAYHAHAWLSRITAAAGTVGVVASSATFMGASIPMVGGIITAITATGTIYAVGQSVASNVRSRLDR